MAWTIEEELARPVASDGLPFGEKFECVDALGGSVCCRSGHGARGNGREEGYDRSDLLGC